MLKKSKTIQIRRKQERNADHEQHAQQISEIGENNSESRGMANMITGEFGIDTAISLRKNNNQKGTGSCQLNTLEESKKRLAFKEASIQQ